MTEVHVLVTPERGNESWRQDYLSNQLLSATQYEGFIQGKNFVQLFAMLNFLQVFFERFKISVWREL